MNYLYVPGRKCRICRKCRVPHGKLEHDECLAAEQKKREGIRFCPKCERMLRNPPQDDTGQCARCARLRPMVECRDCHGKCKGGHERCKTCARIYRRTHKPEKVCRKCGLPGVPRGHGYSLHPACMTRSSRRNAVEKHLQNPQEAIMLAAIGEPLDREDVGCAMRLSHESIRQIELKAFDRFQRHWHVLVELTEQAGLRVDWDWLFGKKTTNDIDLCL